MGSDLIEFTKTWDGGRRVYMGLCARCHGEDGNDTGYPGIKKLGGIGNRHNTETILESSVGFVDLTHLSRKDRDALATFVAGL